MLQVARMSLRFGGLLVLPLVVMASKAEAQEAAGGAAVKECVATVQPAQIKTQADPVVLRAVYSESIGKVLSALAEEKSGIKVVEVKSAAAEPAVSVQLDLSKAVAGEWTLSFEGESGKCTGKVVVQAAEERGR